MKDAIESAAMFTSFAAFAAAMLAAAMFLASTVITPALGGLADYAASYQIAAQMLG